MTSLLAKDIGRSVTIGRMLLGFVSGSVSLNATPSGSERLDLRDYSVVAPLDPSWTAEVQAEKGVVSYERLDYSVAGGMAIHLMAFRVALTPSSSTAEPQKLAEELVRNDGLQYQVSVFTRRFQLPRWSERVMCEAGEAFVFGNDLAVFSDGVAHYGKAALLIPPDYRARRIAYLVVGHQVRRGVTLGLEQDEAFLALLKGLRENRL